MVEPTTIAAIGTAAALNYKLLNKIWDTLFDKVLPGVFAPTQFKRIEKARQDMLLRAADIERRVEDIREGKLFVDNAGRLLPAAAKEQEDEVAPLVVIPENFVRQVTSDAVAEQLENKLALLRIGAFVSEAVEEAAQDEPISDEDLDPDWKKRWTKLAQESRHEYMQRLWAKVAVGENKMPGAYSLRTLEALHLMTKQDAELITRLAPFVVDGQIYSEATSTIEEQGLSFVSLLHLEEMGILDGVSSSGLGLGYVHKNDPPWRILCNDKVLIIRPERDQKDFTLLHMKGLPYSFSRVTSVGRELLSLGKFEANRAYLQKFGDDIKSRGYSVQIADIISRSENKYRIDLNSVKGL